MAQKRTHFIEWLKGNGVQKACNQYESGIRAIEGYYQLNVDDEYQKDRGSGLLLRLQFDSSVLEAKASMKSNKRNWTSYFNKYIKYKDAIGVIDKMNAIIRTNAKKATQDLVNQEVCKDETMQCYLSRNTIFYGVPGCGKSYEINKLLRLTQKDIAKGRSLRADYYARVLFYPEYSYGDFVGQIMPVVKEDKIKYQFQAGPFVGILAQALKDASNHYFLVIEEINRGNAPAIFGDVFQLLDRENGVSEYPITNAQITEYLKEQNVPDEKARQIALPANLTILATMNTCDQNVFTLDTAFKRRWGTHKISNNIDGLGENKIGGEWMEWKAFAKALNEDMLICCKDGMIVEDKLLGAYFVKDYEIADIRLFAEKVIMYLWSDVVKFNKQQLFAQGIDTLEKAIDGFVKRENIFSNNCFHLKELYEKNGSKQAE